MLYELFVRLLYLMGKLYGIVLYRRRQNGELIICQVSLLYARLYCVACTLALPCIQFAYLQFILTRGYNEYTINSVIAINVIASTLRTILVTLQHIVHRRQQLLWVRECFRLQRVMGVEFREFRDQRSLQRLRGFGILHITVGVTVAQVAVIVLNGILFRGDVNLQLQNWVVLVNTHGYAIFSTAAYFGALYAVYRFYVTLNGRLRERMSRIWQADRQQAEESGLAMRMQWDCGLSDELDQLSELYEQITGVLEQINRFYALQLLMSLVVSFSYSLTGFFYIYGDIVKMMRIIDCITLSNYYELIFDITFLSFYFLELNTIVWISNLVKQEAARTQTLLFSTSVTSDVRLKQSIDLFLMRVQNDKPEIVVYGMFSVDNTLIYAMAGTFTSYLTILMQFELADYHASIKHDLSYPKI